MSVLAESSLHRTQPLLIGWELVLGLRAPSDSGERLRRGASGGARGPSRRCGRWAGTPHLHLRGAPSPEAGHGSVSPEGPRRARPGVASPVGPDVLLLALPGPSEKCEVRMPDPKQVGAASVPQTSSGRCVCVCACERALVWPSLI